jgi:hypothetical protein
MFTEKDLRFAEDRRKQFEREAQRQRLANEAQPRTSARTNARRVLRVLSLFF